MKALISSLSLAALALGSSGCVTQTSEGPVAPTLAPTVSATPSRPPSASSSATPRPRPTATPDPLAPAPLQQKPLSPGVSPLNHGADQPLYQRQ